MKIFIQMLKYCVVNAVSLCLLALLYNSLYQESWKAFGATIAIVLMGIPSFIAARIAPLEDVPGWSGVCFVFRQLFVAFFAVCLCTEVSDFLFKDEIPPVCGLFTLVLTILFMYLANKKHWDTFFSKHRNNSNVRSAPPKKSSVSTRKPRSNTPAGRTMSRVDKMDGHDFEQFVADLLRKLGYQGVDILAVREGRRYAIQCKRYSSKLGNKPIQEVHTGKTIYNCQVAVVVTNNYFTPGAMEAARAVGVILWDRDRLQGMIAAAE